MPDHAVGKGEIIMTTTTHKILANEVYENVEGEAFALVMGINNDGKYFNVFSYRDDFEEDFYEVEIYRSTSYEEAKRWHDDLANSALNEEGCKLVATW